MSGGRFALLLVGGVVVIVVCVIVLNFFDPPAQSVRATSAALTIAEQQALAPTWMDVKRGLLTSAGLGGSVLIVSLCLGLSFLMLREPLLLRHSKGIFPAFFSVLGLRASDPPGNQEAQPEYARVAGVQRPLGRPALPRPEAQLALPALDDLGQFIGTDERIDSAFVSRRIGPAGKDPNQSSVTGHHWCSRLSRRQ